MYYEEKVINGALCYRMSPDGAWLQVSQDVVLSRLLHAEKAAVAANEWVEADKQVAELLPDDEEEAAKKFEEALNRFNNACENLRNVMDHYLDSVLPARDE